MPLEPTFRARRLPMTSLIDIIFLLLLFFMLSTTFARYSDLPLEAAAVGTQSSGDAPPRFLQLQPDSLSLNGSRVEPTDLAAALRDGKGPVLVALKGEVKIQRLADILRDLRAIPGLDIRVLD